MRKIYQVKVIFAGTEASLQNRVNKYLFKLPDDHNLTKVDFGYSEKKHFAYITTSMEVGENLEWMTFKEVMHDHFGDNNETL